MSRLGHVAVMESFGVETIDVFHTLKFFSIRSAHINASSGVDDYSFKFSEHGTVRRSINGPSVVSVCVELDASAQNNEEDAGE